MCRKDSRPELANIQWSEKVLIAQVNLLIINLQITKEAVSDFIISFLQVAFFICIQV
jgi:hypothetical protein